ncbi:Uncharacterised protein [Nocardia africana]|uniref:Uncharacterized protein n=1 Tax=Nocardia africana TaxID=134964 RepID=A0A378X249_9NOCA|nr:Uncharacterised protein [Nocardia africana]
MSDSGGLTPLLGYIEANGDQGHERFISDDAAQDAGVGAERLLAGRPNWVRAALVVDAFLHLSTGRIDALIIHAVQYRPDRRSIQMAVPYRPHTSEQGFGVYRPKFLETNGFTDPDYGVMGEAFFAGVDAHEQAVAVWNAHLIDESV